MAGYSGDTTASYHQGMRVSLDSADMEEDTTRGTSHHIHWTRGQVRILENADVAAIFTSRFVIYHCHV